MNEREYRRLLKEIEADYQRKKTALQVVYEMTGPPRASQAKGATLDAVRGVLDALPEPFSMPDVYAMILQANPGLAAEYKRVSISSALARLAEDKEIDIVKEGSGRRPATYRRKAKP